MPSRSGALLAAGLALATVASACTETAPRSRTTRSAEATDADRAALASAGPWQGWVDVGEYYLPVACRGQGTPAVIIEDALGVPALESGGWWPVVDEVEAFTRICVYDRAGLGLSGAPPALPRTSQEVVNDLDELLSGAPVPGPYVLVGHSVGGLHVLLYARQHPHAVAGLVLVNGTHPDQWTALQALLPAEVPGEPASLSRLRAIQAQPADNPERLDVIASAGQVRAALTGGQPLGDLPLAVVTRSPLSPMVPFLPREIAGPGARLWQNLQADLAALSSNGIQMVAARGGHNLQREEPELVVDAIRRVHDQAAARLN